MTRTVCTVTYDDEGKPVVSTYTTQVIDEAEDADMPRRMQQRELLNSSLVQVRCLLKDDLAYPITDHAIGEMPFEEVLRLKNEVDQKLDELWEPIQRRQQEREGDSLRLGIKRYRESLDKRGRRGEAIEDAAGEALIRKYAEPLRMEIINYVNNCRVGNARQNAVESIKFVELVNPAIAAYITARIVLAGCFTLGSLPKSMDAIQGEVAKAIELEGMADDIKAAIMVRPTALRDAAAEAKEKARTRKERDSAARQYRRWNKILKEFGENPKPNYTPAERDKGGLQLVALLLQVNGDAFRRVNTKFGKTTYTTILPTDGLIKEFQKTHMDRIKLFPVDRPMLCPPFPWQTVYGEGGKEVSITPGGYRYDGRKRRISGPVNMIKTTEPEGLRRFEEFLKTPWGESEIVREAVNALQMTPFRINRRIFETMDTVKKAEAYAKFKLPELREPKKTASYIERSEWWRTGQAKATVFLNQLIEAERDLEEPAIFFPHTFDFRGRVYPMGGPLNPQNNSIAKALLEFAEGRRMGEHPEAGKWLAIHGANCWGLDKESITERVKWVEENTQMIN